MKNRDVVHRTSNRLRLVMLWARKGAMLRRKVVMKLRLVPEYLKCLCYTAPPPAQTLYSERELSFDNTHIFHVKTNRPFSMHFHLPHISCINPRVDFDDDHDDVEYDHERNSPLMGAGNHNEEYYYDCQEEEEEEEDIDKRAEEFIAKFYQQMKLQRLQYNETPNRDST
ncbi:uncharacterized protein LOC133297974 [Gastrolobium bilobum]|uniref:uncharacterized protein LOC133297974 n=1 Tax=Gastrolobium bilobum TaxID=150636 RepID=UPI002AB25E6D|nr:uncharacterized protein LOC133297974 [Gastrolobium bilobum]